MVANMRCWCGSVRGRAGSGGENIVACTFPRLFVLVSAQLMCVQFAVCSSLRAHPRVWPCFQTILMAATTMWFAMSTMFMDVICIF